MLIVVEKPAVKNMLYPFLTESDEALSIFGKEGVSEIIPEGLPCAAMSLENIIRHGCWDDVISFDTLQYFIVKGILGKAGKQFRDALVALAQKHEKVVFAVEPDYMLLVANRLITNMSDSISADFSVVPLADMSSKSLQAIFT